MALIVKVNFYPVVLGVSIFLQTNENGMLNHA